MGMDYSWMSDHKWKDEDKDKKKSSGSSESSKSSASASPSARDASRASIEMHTQVAQAGGPVTVIPSSKYGGGGGTLYFERSGNQNNTNSGNYNRNTNNQNKSQPRAGSSSAAPENATQGLLAKTGPGYRIEGISGIPDIRSDNWYSGDGPNAVDNFARIYALTNGDEGLLTEAWEARFTPGETGYSAYAGITSEPVARLAQLGIEIPQGGLTREWFEKSAPFVTPNYRPSKNSTTGAPTLPKRASKDEQIAYWWYQAEKDLDDTDKAENEMAALREEIAYLASSPKNYNDQEILDQIDWNKYKTLQKMEERAGEGTPLPLVRTIDFSKDYLPGMIWAARNGVDTGSAFFDAVNGRIANYQGGYTANDEVRAKLDPNSDRFSPYSLGSTMEDAGLYYGTYSFDDKWLEEHREDGYSSDETKRRNYARVYEANEFTKKCERELNGEGEDSPGLLAAIEDELKWDSTSTPEEILSRLLEDRPNLKRLDETAKSGRLLDTTRAINYSYNDMLRMIEERRAQQAAEPKPDKDRETILQKLAGAGQAAITGIGDVAGGIMNMFNPQQNPVPENGEATEPPVDQNGNVVTPSPSKSGTAPEMTEEMSRAWENRVDLAGLPVMSDGGSYAYRPTPRPDTTPSPDSVRRTETEAEGRKNREQALDAAGPFIREAGTETDKLAFQYGGADAENTAAEVMDAINSGAMTAEQGRDYLHGGADQFAAKNYFGASLTVKDFERRSLALAEKQARLAAMPEVDAAAGSAEDIARQKEAMLLEAMQTGNMDLYNQAQALGEPDPEQQRIALVRQQLEEEIAQEEAALDAMRPEVDKAQETIGEVQRGYDVAETAAGVTGIEANGSLRATEVVDYLLQLDGYQMPDWSAWSVYDQALREGADYADVAAGAKETAAQYRKAAEGISLALAMADEMGIQIPDDYRANLENTRQYYLHGALDGEYLQVRGEPDFKEVADKARQEVKDRVGSLDRDKRDIFQPISPDDVIDRILAEPETYASKYLTDDGPVQFGQEWVNQRIQYLTGALTPEEYDTYFFLKGKYGDDASKQYLDHLTDYTYGRASARYAENEIARARQETKESGWSALLKTIGTSLVSPLTNYEAGAQVLMDKMLGISSNPYAPGFINQMAAGATRDEAKSMFVNSVGGADSLTGKFASFGFDAFTSAMDSTVNAAVSSLVGLPTIGGTIGGKIAGEFGAKVGSSMLGASLMSFGSFGNTYREIKERGGDDNQALVMASIAGVAEAVTEGIEYNDIKGAFWKGAETQTTAEGFLAYFKKQIPELQNEFFGEAVSDAIQGVSDDTIMGALSNRNTSIIKYTEELMAQNPKMDETVARSAAEKRANQEFWSGVIRAGVLGSASAGLSTTAGYALGRAKGAIFGTPTDGTQTPQNAPETTGEETPAQAETPQQNASQNEAEAQEEQPTQPEAEQTAEQGAQNNPVRIELTEGEMANPEQIGNYVDYALSYDKSSGMDKNQDSISYGKVSDRLVSDLAGEVDISEYTHVLRDNDIRHIRNSHGEGTNEKYPVTADDIKRIPDIVENYDDVLFVPHKNGQNGIYYVQQHNGVTYYLEAITQSRGGKKQLVNKQMIKVPTGTIPDVRGLKAAITKKWGSFSALDDATANTAVPRMYVQDAWIANPSEENITQPEQRVNEILPAEEAEVPEAQEETAPTQQEAPDYRAKVSPLTGADAAKFQKRLVTLQEAAGATNARTQGTLLSAVFDSISETVDRLSHSQAAAAVGRMMDRIGGPETARMLQDVLIVTATTGDTAEVMQDIQTAAMLGDTSALEALADGRVTQEKVATFKTQISEQMTRPEVLEQIRARAMDQLISEEKRKLIEEGAMADVNKRNRAERRAKQDLENAQEGYRQATAQVSAAQENLRQTQEAFLQNPTDPQAEGNLREMTRKVQNAFTVQQQYEQSVANKTKSWEDSRNAYLELRRQRMEELRAQATANAQAAMESANEKRAQIEQRRRAQSEAQQGKTGRTYIKATTPVNFHYAAIDVDGLITSNDEAGNRNPDYPQELQPRDRTRTASRAQLETMSRTLNPELLGADNSVTGGAPIVGPDYVVESGNQRTMAIRQAMAQAHSENYTAWLREHAADFGLDPAGITDRSVLVRVRDTDVDRVQFAREANESVTAAMSQTETAGVDAQNMDERLLNLYDVDADGITSASNRDFVASFLQTIPEAERGLYIQEDGSISQAGVTRIRNALFQAAYGDQKLTSALAESTDDSVRNVTAALTNAAPKLATYNKAAENGSRYDMSLSEMIAEAARLYRGLRAKGESVEDWMNQVSMFDPTRDGVQTIMQMFEANARSGKKITRYLTDLIQHAEALGDPNQTMLGGLEQQTQTPDEFIARSFAETEANIQNEAEGAVRGQTALFDAETRDTVTKQALDNYLAENGITLEGEEYEQELARWQDEARQAEREMQSEQSEMDMQARNRRMQRMRDLARRYSRAFGVEIRFESGRDENGRLIWHGKRDTNTGVIYIDSTMTETELFHRTLLHELTHHVEQTGEYGQLQNTLLNLRYGTNWEILKQNQKNGRLTENDRRLLADIEAKQSLYSKGIGQELTPEEALQEITADATYDIFEGNEQLIRDFVNQDRSLAERVFEWIKNALAKLRGENTGNLSKARDLFAKALQEAESQNGTGQNRGTQYSRVGTSEDGRGIYESNFPEGTPREVKRQRVIQLWQQVWSQQPIQLNIPDGQGGTREITAQFDPDYDPANLRMTDLGKAMANKNGSSGDRNITLNLADDLYDIARESEYYASEKERGKTGATHQGVREWHYFFNDILYRDSNEDEKPYTVWLDVKERDNGGWVYQLYAKKSKKKEGNAYSAAPSENAELPGEISPGVSTALLSEQSVPQSEPTVNSDDQYSLPETQQRDTEYQQAVDNGDMETAQRLTDEAAQKAGYTIHAYHGTGRGDRVGNVFRPERATSGPMAFFTSDRTVAENYAKDKRDTSIAYDERYDSYETQFRASKDGQDKSLIEVFDELPASAKAKIRSMAPHVTLDYESGEDVVYDPSTKNGLGNYDYALRGHNRNPIAALVEGWLTDGTLYGEEDRFVEVLEKAGVTDALRQAGWSVPEYLNPDARNERVYDTYLKIQNPFNTKADYNEEFLNGLETWWAQQDQDAYRKESSGADTWDKNNRSVEEWIDWARGDLANGMSNAWTSIPDAVTDYLKSLGYDGIQDVGGKNGGASHTVYIPFTGEQVKESAPITRDDSGNVIPLSQRFNQSNPDIRYALPSDNNMDAIRRQRVRQALSQQQARQTRGQQQTEIQAQHQSDTRVENLLQMDPPKRRLDLRPGTLATHIFDKTHPLFKMTQASMQEQQARIDELKAKQKSGVKLTAEEKAIIKRGVQGYDSSRDVRDLVLAKGNAIANSTDFCLTKHMVDAQGNRVYRADGSEVGSLADILGKIDLKDEKAFNAYWLALYMKERQAAGKEVNRGLTDTAAMDRTIASTEAAHPEWRGIVDEACEWYGQFMQTWLVNEGLVRQSTLDTFRTMYPHYVPVFSGEVNDSAAKGRDKNQMQAEHLHFAGEGGGSIYNPVMGMAESVQRHIENAKQAEVMRAFGDFFSSDLGRSMGLVQELDPTPAQEKNGAGVGAMEAMSNFQWVTQDPATRQDVLHVPMPDGSVRNFICSDSGIIKALVGTQATGKGLQATARLTGFMCAFATAKNLAFSVQNFLSDGATAMITGNTGGNILTYNIGRLASMFDLARNQIREARGKETSETYQKYQLFGGMGSRYAMRETDVSREFRGKLYKNEVSTIGHIAQFLADVTQFKHVEAISEFLEQATRYNEFSRGNHDLNSYEGLLAAAKAQREVTTDFSKSGDWAAIQYAGQLIPFIRAQMQGTYKTIRMFSEENAGNRGRYMRRIVFNTLVSSAVLAALRGLDWDDEEKKAYEEMNAYEKVKYGHIKIGGKILRIKRTQDGILGFANAVGDMLGDLCNGYEDNDYAQFFDCVEEVAKGLLPSHDTVFEPFMDAANNQTWYGSRIEDAKFDGMAEQDKYESDTLPVFRWASNLSNAVGVTYSPLDWQYICQQYMGSAGRIILGEAAGIGGALLDGEEFTPFDALGIAGDEVLGRVAYDPVYSNYASSTFYDGLTMLSGIQATSDNIGQPGHLLRPGISQAEHKQALKEIDRMTSKGGSLYTIRKNLSGLWKKYNAIDANEMLTDSQKEEAKRNMRRQINEQALRGNTIISQFMGRYGRKNLKQKTAEGVLKLLHGE